jgi:hypothetical protein
MTSIRRTLGAAEVSPPAAARRAAAARLIHITLGALMVLAPLAASARYHQICFEGHPEELSPGQRKRIVVAICEDDSGGACSISASQGAWSPIARASAGDPRTLDLHPTAAGGQRTIRDYYWDGKSDIAIDFEFGGGVVKRRCTVSQGAWRIPRGQLTSFSTDRSGLATTGVWRFHAIGPWANPTVPSGFVVVGGGTVATQTDAFFSRSDDTGLRAAAWFADTRTELGASPATTLGYAIGLRIANIDEAALPIDRSSQGSHWASGMVQADPAARVSPPPGSDRVALGGGVLIQSSSRPGPMFATVSAPVGSIQYLLCATAASRPLFCPDTTVAAWLAEAKHPFGAASGTVTASLQHLPRLMDIVDPVTGARKTWLLQVTMRSATSAAGTHPTATASGLRGEFALTGAGSEVDWRSATANNLQALTPLPFEVEPRADLGAVRAAARPGSAQAVAPVALTAHAVGLRLVEPKSLPLLQLVADKLWTWQFCRADIRTVKDDICRDKARWMSPSELCWRYPGLSKHGYCRPDW